MLTAKMISVAKHAHAAEAIGNDPAERLADAPEQILYREREGEDVAAPMIGARQRREKKTERRARPECDQRNQAAEADHQRRRPPARESFGNVAHVAPAKPRFESRAA